MDEVKTKDVVTPAHTEAEEEYLNNLYATLKPEAMEVYVQYFLARTPAHLQEDMMDLLAGDLSTPPTPPVEARRSEGPRRDRADRRIPEPMPAQHTRDA